MFIDGKWICKCYLHRQVAQLSVKTNVSSFNNLKLIKKNSQIWSQWGPHNYLIYLIIILPQPHENKFSFRVTLISLIRHKTDKRCGRLKNVLKSSRQRPSTLLKKEALAQVFSCEFSKISKNTFLQNTSARLLL